MFEDEFRHNNDGESSTTSADRDSVDEEEAHLVAGDYREDTFMRRPDRRPSWFLDVRIALTVFNIVLFAASVVMLVLSRGGDKHRCSDQDAWRATSYYSPVFDRFNIPKITRITNGTFWDTKPPSIWRQRTGAEADAAWESVGSNIQPIIISASDVRTLGKDPSIAVKAGPALGYGDDAYIAGLDVFHHLHCLDKLRREISYSHYHEAEEGPRPGSAMHKAHIDHCVDILAQALKCTGSVDVVTFNWVEGHRLPQPDFNNKKVCRDFDSLRDWTVANGIDGQAFFDGVDGYPPEAVVVPEFHPQRRRR